MLFNIIAACDNKNGIVYKNKLPWVITKDLRRFKELTMNNIVIMGRKTWESLIIKPLPYRCNIVISSTLEDDRVDHIFKTFDQALTYIDVSKIYNSKTVYVIGGEQLYKEAINNILCDKVLITEVYKNHLCDTHFPELPKNFSLVNVSDFMNENDYYFRYFTYCRFQLNWKNEEEDKYLMTFQNYTGSVSDEGPNGLTLT